MIVITLSKVPLSLRGDLTKWCQEVQTGVYVGNFSARIRDLLWERIQQNLKTGEATLIYSTNNELGYTFKTTREDKKVVDFDGLPLMKQLTFKMSDSKKKLNYGWSNAAKFHQAKRAKNKINDKQILSQKNVLKNVVCIDTETTGLDPEKDKLIDIAAVRRNKIGKLETFQRYVRVNQSINSKISQLTGITESLLNTSGIELKNSLVELKKFVGNDLIIGYNVRFDLEFLRFGFIKVNEKMITNENKDLLRLVKKKNKFMSNYHLSSVLEQYGITNKRPHSASGDALATFLLGEKLYNQGVLKL